MIAFIQTWTRPTRLPTEITFDPWRRLANWYESIAAEAGSRSLAMVRSVFSPVGLAVLWSYIFVVSCYDIWLVIAVDDVIFESEQNPICLALIKFDTTYYSLFISSKVAGTLFTLWACERLVEYRRDIGASVTSGIACCQTGLLMYLSM